MFRILFILLFIGGFSLYGQKNQPIGARAGGMGNAALCISDVWAVHQNQANLAFLDKAEAGFFYRNQFFMADMGYGGAALALPNKFGTVGVSLFSLGNNLYRENEYGLGFAQKFGENVGMALQLNYSEVVFGESYGKKGALNGEFGVIVKLNDEFSMAAHIYNPTRARFAVFDDERLPTILRSGFSYKMSKFARFSLEGEKEIDQPFRLKVGTELLPLEGFHIRAGALTQPLETTFGFGFHSRGFYIDVAAAYHSILGYSPMAGFSYKFQ